MVKNFITYKDFTENCEEIPDLENIYFIRKSKKNKNYYFLPLESFTNEEILAIIKKEENLTYDKKNNLFIEIDDDLKTRFDRILIRKYKNIYGNVYEKVKSQNDEISLIKYNCISNISNKELDNGKIVTVMPCISDKKHYYICSDRENYSTLQSRRSELQNMAIASDLYFHTNDTDLLENYKDDLVVFTRIDSNKYELKNVKLFIIDSIPTDRIYNLTSKNYNCFFKIMDRAIPVNIVENGNGYNLNIESILDNEKKGYIIMNDIMDYLSYSNDIEPFIKYINVYELIDGVYEKTSLEQYLKSRNILKYIKKPNN